MKLDDLIFDNGWRKTIFINFQNQNTNIELVFDAYDDEQVNDEQIDSYKIFIQNQSTFEQKMDQLLSDFILTNKIDNPSVQAKSLYFNRQGGFALLCDCSWDTENGIAIILKPKESIAPQDDVL